MAGIGIPLIFNMPYYVMFGLLCNTYVRFRSDEIIVNTPIHGDDAKND